MFKCFAFLVVVCFSVMAQSFELSDEKLKFSYQPNDFEGASCIHERIRDLPDWKVVCESRYHKKEFVVHLIVKKYRKNEPSLSAFEVLYWVTNRDHKRRVNEHTGTSMLFTVRNDVKAEEIRMGQVVDGGYAHLNLHLSL